MTMSSSTEQLPHAFDEADLEILDQIFEPAKMDSHNINDDDASVHGFDSNDAFDSPFGGDECTVVTQGTLASNATHASSQSSTDFATTMRQFRGSFPSLSYNHQMVTNAAFHRIGSSSQRRSTKRQSKKRARSVSSSQIPLPYNPQDLGITALPPAPKKVELPPAPYDPSVIVAAMEAHEFATSNATSSYSRRVSGSVPPRKRAKAARRCSVTEFNLSTSFIRSNSARSTNSSDDEAEDFQNTPGYQASLQKLADSMKRTELSRRQLMMSRKRLGLDQIQPSVPVLPQRTVSPEPPATSEPTVVAESDKESIRNAFFSGSRVTLTDGLEQSRRELRRNSIVLNRWNQ